MTDNFIRLSQAQLNLLETCPPQFQRLYLEQLGSPLSPQQQEKQTWGSQFHLLMQQKELGLPIESLVAQDEQLQHSITALMNAAPEIWQSESGSWREAEHCRTLSFQGYLLTVVYDLLMSDRAKAKIVDWKTYLFPENRAKLAKNWQTRLYLYVLAETTDYLPEQISMTYWFVKLPTQPQSLTFVYNSVQHEKNRQDLTRLLTQLDRWLDNYSNAGTSFPHLSNCQESCPYYQSLLEFGAFLDSDRFAIEKDWIALIDEIEEISID
ncbi:MAG: PD-(D/E)XK nuclease family protein [Hydrococcus sp. C42_A2020_068]|nr:PD-(D/E)XK nuclease family protein [Hydrococcus sp. C42_A2020_068]